MKAKPARLLLFLDDLFDTRIGTIARISNEIAAKHLHDPAYTARLWDLFPEVDPKQYAELYAKRDRRTLVNAQTTPVIGMIRDFVKRCAQTTYEKPIALEPEIHINFYPYQLTKQEQDLIVESVRKLIPLKPEIKGVWFSNEQLNPLYCRNNYNTIIHYHGYEWLEMHSQSKALMEYKCPNVTLFVPALLTKRPEGTKVPENLGDYFYSLSIFSQLVINLTFVGVDNFCSFLAQKSKVEEAPKESWAEEGEGNFTGSQEPREGTLGQDAPPGSHRG